MIASLPMYWRAENAASWTRYWQAVRLHLPDLPDLTPPEGLPTDWDAHWRAYDLRLSQTCGLPYRARLHPHVTYIGSFDFALPDTPAGYYHSVVLTRLDENRPHAALRLAYNAADSQSGWAATKKGQSFASYLCTGAHRASAIAVADGGADIAYVDAVTWRLLTLIDPDLTAQLTVAERTAPTPGLPLIAAAGTDPGPLRTAMTAALHALTDDDRRDLGSPKGLVVLDPKTYLDMPIPASPPA